MDMLKEYSKWRGIIQSNAINNLQEKVSKDSNLNTFKSINQINSSE